MTTTPQTAPKTEAQEYLDMVYSSWPSVGFIQRQGKAMLVKNLGMTDDEAKGAVQEWIKSKGQEAG